MDVQVLQTGCCGLAGSFGFERGEKYRVSQAIGELDVFPKVRALDADTVLVGDGFSCREQIGDGTARRPLHVAEVARLAVERRARRGAAAPDGVTDLVPAPVGPARLDPRRPAAGGGAGAGRPHRRARAAPGTARAAPAIRARSVERLGARCSGRWLAGGRGAGGAGGLASRTGGDDEERIGNWASGVGHRRGVHPVGQQRSSAADDQPRNGLSAERRQTGTRTSRSPSTTRTASRAGRTGSSCRRAGRCTCGSTTLKDPEPIPRDTDYSSVIESDVPIVVQHTRLDTRQSAAALLSTIAFAP